jgi:TolB-like protein
MNDFFQRLRQRKLVQWTIAYVAAAFALLQGIDIVAQQFGWPDGVRRGITIALGAGFFVTIVLAWYHGERGTQRVTTAELLIIALLLAIAGGVLWRFAGNSRESIAKSNEVQIPSHAITEKSIAVLPFESLSEDKSNAYFADGIQDEILARLSKIADLKVISRTSTQKYKSAPDNLREIAQQLGVANILEGSVQKAGDQVRITVQLINALKDDHLWADTYDRKMVDIFGVESDVAQKIAASLEATLTGREKQEIAFVGTRNPEAYDAVLHALALRGSQHAADVQKQFEFLQRAVDVDPDYPQAWAYLGAAEAGLYFFPDHTEARKEKARMAVETALRLAPALAEAHAALGVYRYYCLQDYDGALVELNIAREHAPNDGNIVLFSALVQRRQGKVNECIDGLQQAAVLDPLNEDIPVNLGRTYRGVRRFEEARAMFDRALTIVPNDVEPLCMKAETYLAQGDVETAWRMISGLKISPLDAGFGTYMNLLAVRGQFDEMIAAISSALAAQEDFPPVFRSIAPAALASVHTAKGDRTGALPFYAQATQNRKTMSNQQQLTPLAYTVFIEMEARFGEREAVERDVNGLFEQTRKDKWQFPNSEYSAAGGYALLGDLDHALPLLRDALAQPCEESPTVSYLRLEPIWDPVRNDPRFQKLIAGDAPARSTKP